MAQPFAHPALMGLLRPLVYAHAESMTQPVTLMFVPGSSAIAIKETVIAAAIKNRCVLFTLILRKCCGWQRVCSPNAILHLAWLEESYFCSYLETSIDRLNPLGWEADNSSA